jgi:LPXTG-site transpeptidase (sortase) family protein
LRRAPLLALSIVFAAVGVALVAAFAIGAFSGGEQSQHVVTPAVRHLSVEPDHIFDGLPVEVTPRPTSRPTATPPPAQESAPLGQASFTLEIPAIGVNAPVNPYGLDANYIPQVPYNGWEVAWYNWSAKPGTGSNAVLAGHVTWAGAGVFYSLERLSPGDEIILRNDAGTELKYTVDDNFLVDPSDTNALSVMHGTDDDRVTLITCGGDWYNDPGAEFGVDYTHRRVVQAHFTSLTPAPENAVAAASADNS